MSEKLYGALKSFQGWTLGELAIGLEDAYLTKELARDLIAAQARIAELDSQATWFSKIARETADKLAAAEAAIAAIRGQVDDCARDICGSMRGPDASVSDALAAIARRYLDAEATIDRVIAAMDMKFYGREALADKLAEIEAALSPPIEAK